MNPWIAQALQDIRYAARMLTRNRAFTGVAILSLALGIGATTSVFSVVDRILFRSLPYAYGDRLISVGIAAPMLPYEFVFGAAYLDLREHQQAFEAVTSWSGVSDCDLTDGEPVRLACAAVESTFLSTVGITPVLGRSFSANEDGPSRPKVALLSYGLWQSRFGGRPDVLERTISLDGQPARIVGVLPPDFETPTLARADLVIPQGLDNATLQRAVTGRPLRVLARMRPGTDLRAMRASAEVTLGRLLANAAPGPIAKEIRPRIRTLRDLQVGDGKTVSWVLFGSVLAVLLLACDEPVEPAAGPLGGAAARMVGAHRAGRRKMAAGSPVLDGKRGVGARGRNCGRPAGRGPAEAVREYRARGNSAAGTSLHRRARAGVHSGADVPGGRGICRPDGAPHLDAAGTDRHAVRAFARAAHRRRPAGTRAVEAGARAARHGDRAGAHGVFLAGPAPISGRGTSIGLLRTDRGAPAQHAWNRRGGGGRFAPAQRPPEIEADVRARNRRPAARGAGAGNRGVGAP